MLASAEAWISEAAPLVAGDPARPGYHFTGAARSIGDPNGPIQFGGAYHLFYQHHGGPDLPFIACWGHAVSEDLIHWKRLPLALAPTPGTYDDPVIASGYTVFDGEAPTIIYTAAEPQTQALARSFDGGLTWFKFEGNPVIPNRPPVANLRADFRDPFVWKEGDLWKMVVGSAIEGEGGTALRFESPNLVDWTFTGFFPPELSADCIAWECPNFYPLTTPEGEEYWVLVISPLFSSQPGLRGYTRYTVGKWDGTTFDHGEWHPMELSADEFFYAPNSLRDDRGRRLMWGWLIFGSSDGSPWQGLHTLPRELTLDSDLRLRQWPAEEITKLRQETLFEGQNVALEAGESLDLAPGNLLEVELTLPAGSTGRVRLEMLRAPDAPRLTPIIFDCATGALQCGGRAGQVELIPDTPIVLRVFLDRHLLEVYAAGRGVISERAAPQPGDLGVRLIAEGAALELTSIKEWRLEDIWQESEPAT